MLKSDGLFLIIGYTFGLLTAFLTILAQNMRDKNIEMVEITSEENIEVNEEVKGSQLNQSKIVHKIDKLHKKFDKAFFQTNFDRPHYENYIDYQKKKI